MSNKCLTDANCLAHQICQNLKCVHKGIENPLEPEIIGWIFLPILLALINVAGQSGGLVKIPIYVLALQYTVSQAGMFQYLSIFGCSFSNCTVIVPQRHPDPQQICPLIDFNFILIVWPALLLSNTIGIYINNISPDIAVSILLNVVLVWAIGKISLQIYHKLQGPAVLNQQEISNPITNHQAQAHPPPLQLQQIKLEQVPGQTLWISPQKNDNDVLIPQQKSDAIKKPSFPVQIQQIGTDDKQYQHYQAIVAKEKRMIPVTNFLFIFLTYFVFFALELVMGNKKVKSISDVKLCSDLYWGLGGLRLLLIIIATGISYFWLKSEYRLKKKFNHKITIQYDGQSFIIIFMIGILSGFLIGAVGTGLGLIALPYMVGIGHPPRVPAATISFLNFLLSVAGLTQFILGKYANSQIIVFYVLLSFFGSLILTWIITFFQNQYQLVNLPLILSTTVFLISVLSNISYMAVQYPQKTYQQIYEGGDICK